MSREERPADPQELRGEVAIIGVSGMFAQAPDVETYWQNIVAGREAIVESPADRWDQSIYYHPDAPRTGYIYCKVGGYLDYPLPFQPAAHGVMPVSAKGGEAEQLLFLDLVQRALDNAGYKDRPLPRERTETVVARGNYMSAGLLGLTLNIQGVEDTLRVLRGLHPEYPDEVIAELREALRAKLPPYNNDSAIGLIPNVMAGRVANRLDLMGSNYTVDAACASSLVALETVVRDLLTHKCDVGIVGAAHTFTPSTFLVQFTTFGALSHAGHCRPFDQDADGTLPGEGLAVLILKRLADAERDHDPIYAVVKGVGVASDGKALSPVAPRLEGEQLAVRRAYQMAGLDPRTVDLVEAHGTGTPLGDETELQMMHSVFGPRGADEPRAAVGSVKSMVGHCMQAAGMAGLIKAVLALRDKILPPTLHGDRPHALLSAAESPLYLNTQTRPWIHTRTEPRRAGVSAFGFGGINSHAVLEEYRGPADTNAEVEPKDVAPWPNELFVLRAGSAEELASRCDQLSEVGRTRKDLRLAALAASLAAQPPSQGEKVLAVVSSSTDELAAKLSRARAHLLASPSAALRDPSGIYWTPAQPGQKGKVAFLFPGLTSVYVDMLRDLCLHFPQARSAFEHGPGLGEVVFPPPEVRARQRAEELLRQSRWGPPALLAANRAVWNVLAFLGLSPDMLGGHSLGDQSAVEAAGITDLPPLAQGEAGMLEGSELIKAHRSREPIVALSVAEGLDRLAPLLGQLKGKVHLLADNCAHQVILTTTAKFGPELERQLRLRKMLFETLPLEYPAHTPWAEPLREHVRKVLAAVPVRPAALPVYSGSAPLPLDAAGIRQRLADACVLPVEFRRMVLAMHEAGARVFVECGPRASLTAFVADTLGDLPHLAVAVDSEARGSGAHLNHVLGTLCAAGLGVDLPKLFRRRGVIASSLEDGAQPPRGRGEVMLSLGNPRLSLTREEEERFRRAAGASRAIPAASGPAFIEPTLEPEIREGVPAGEPMTSGVVQQYFELMAQFVTTQRDVMHSYLSGAEPTEAPDFSSALPAFEEPSAAVPIHGGSAAETLARSLLAITSEKTGYPADMLGMDMNLEADLGIDSIKRSEIVAAFQRQHGRANGTLPSVSTFKTLRDMINYFSQATDRGAPAVAKG